MKAIGEWASQNRLLCTSLEFSHEAPDLQDAIGLVGASSKKAQLAVRLQTGDQTSTTTLAVGTKADESVLQLVQALDESSDVLEATRGQDNDGLVIGVPSTYGPQTTALMHGVVLCLDLMLRSAYEQPICVEVAGKSTRTPEPFDAFLLNGVWMDSLGIAQESYATVLDVTTGTIVEARLRKDFSKTPVSAGQIRVSSHAAMRLGFGKHDRLVVLRHRELSFDRVMIQQLEHIVNRNVLIGDEDLACINRRYAYHRVTCPATGCSLVVPTAKFERGPEHASGEGVPHSIRLSRQQRELLGLHTPYVLAPWFLEKLQQPGASPKAAALLNEYYVEGTLAESLDYDVSQKIWRALKAEGFDAVRVSPLVDAPVGAPRVHNNRVVRQKDKVLSSLTDRYLGQASGIYRVARPYEVDEDRRIVRLPQDTLSLLGLDIMDCAIVSYGLRSVSVRVLAIENEDKIRRMDALSDSDTVDVLIGMPALIRSELCLDGLGMSVEVKRDTRFLFAKTINQQFVPALGLFFTVLSIFPPSEFDLWVPSVIFVVLLPFVAYSILSDERSKVHNR